MKIRLKRIFKVQTGPRSTSSYAPGIYRVPEDISGDHAKRALQQRVAETVVEEKKAPENKVVETPESKSKVGRKTKRGRGARAKSDK